MSWIKLDDCVFTNPKVYPLSQSAKLLYLQGICYASQNLTDGFVAKSALSLLLSILGAKPKDADELVTAGLWDKAENGWQIHDYVDHQETAEQVKRKREATAERQKRFRNGDTSGPSKTVSNAVTNSVSNSNDNGVSNKTRQDKTRQDKNREETDKTDSNEAKGLPEIGSGLPVEERSPASGSSSVSQNFIEDTLTAHPSWKEPLALLIKNNKPRNPNAYTKSTLQNWMRGDGTPPPPGRSTSEPSKVGMPATMPDILKPRESTVTHDPGFIRHQALLKSGRERREREAAESQAQNGLPA